MLCQFWNNLGGVFIQIFSSDAFLIHYRSSHRRCSVKKGVIKNFTKFTGKHLCQSLFFNIGVSFLNRRLWHRYFPVDFVKFLRAPFSQNTSGQLLLSLRSSWDKFACTFLFQLLPYRVGKLFRCYFLYFKIN